MDLARINFPNCFPESVPPEPVIPFALSLSKGCAQGTRGFDRPERGGMPRFGKLVPAKSYLLDIQEMSREFLQSVKNGRLGVAEAADQAQAMRQQILELTRMRTSPTVRAFVTSLKKASPSLASLAEKNAQLLFNRSFVSLAEAEQAAVWLRIVERSGTDRTSASVLAKRLGMVGRRLLLVSIAIGVYEVYEAEDKPREVARQGSMAVVGALGGWAVGSGAVAAGVCAATAPVCVGAVAIVGGILCAFGSDLAFGTIYPRPARRLE